MSKTFTDLKLNRAQFDAMLRAWLGSGVVCTGARQLQGGMISSVWWLDFDRPPHAAVVKVAPLDSDDLQESRRITCLRRDTRFPCAEAFFEDNTGTHVPYRFLLLEALPGKNLHGVELDAEQRASVDTQLAHILLELHNHTRSTFGEPWDEGCRAWSEIHVGRMREMRGEVNGRLPSDVLEGIDRAIEVAPAALDAQGVPTLVHGDIWDGNILVAQEDGCWRITGIVDPGTQYADVEMELAYLEVFGAERPTFFESYTADRPMRSGYETRRLFYWLNTAMIHVWLFGDEFYCRSTAETVARINREV